MGRRVHGGRTGRRSSGAKEARDREAAPKKALPHNFRPFETFEATFMGMPDGPGGFIRPIGFNKADGGDLFVDWRDASSAVHGDRVKAEALGSGFDGRHRGRVVKVIARTDSPIAATLQKQAWGWRALPLDPRMQQIISVQPTDLAAADDFVTVLLEPDPTSAQLRGTVMARLGRASDLKIENRLTAAMFNLRTDFPNAVLDELAAFPTQMPEEWAKGREDLRGLLTATVDPPTAKDYDDAISLELLPREEGGGWILGVHIADVSHYVAEKGPLDQEAQARGTSVYFPDECIPMLPDRLSAELCSLAEGVDRLAMTAWMTISPSLEVIEARFAESVIHSRRRLTYDQVKEACISLDKRARHEIGEELCQMLDHALVLSRRLTEKRLGRGALNLDTEETEFTFDNEGRPDDARRAERHDAHRMIEEFMLLANEAAARHFGRNKCPSIYRIHEEPDPLKLEAFKDLAAKLGLMKPKDRPTPEHLNALLDKIRGGPLEAMLNAMLLRSLKRAEYSADNMGHSGLALDEYLHFTSPIRRYPDLIVHRLMKKLLRKEKMPIGLQGHLAMQAKRASDCEQLATEAERENQKWKSCLLMKNKIGEKFQGTIQGFSMKAAFVRLDSPFVEVGVPLSALGGGFSVDEHRTKATGLGGQAVLAIGTKVLAEITSIDESLHRISAWILEASAQDQNGKAIVFSPNLLGPTTLRESDFVIANQASPGGRRAPGGGAAGKRPRSGAQGGGKSAARPGKQRRKR
jgi:ribonuclease R